MEKSAVRFIIIVRIGLLILCGLSAPRLFAAEGGLEPARLKLIPQSPWFFTSSEGLFTLTINGVPPADVRSDMPELPDNVSFIASKRDALPGGEGTLLQLWFTFKRPGTYELSPLQVQIKGRRLRVPFAEVRVYENTDSISPELSVVFDEKSLTATAGQTLHFTLYVRYAVQITEFSWEIPEEAVFTELERYEITAGNPRGSGFSPDAVPVARFAWQPLKSGVAAFPAIHIVATAYSGKVQPLVLPDVRITVLPAPAAAEPVQRQNKDAAEKEKLFAYAFTEVPEEKKTAAVAATAADVALIRDLRCKERHSLPGTSAAAKRAAAETAAGLTQGASEPSVPLFYLLAAAGLILAVLAAAAFVKKRLTPAVICLSAGCLFLFGAIISGVYLSRLYGVSAGAEASPVPEKNSTSTVSVPAGIRVKIVETAGSWVYIDCGETGGWVPENSVLPVK